MHNAYRQKLNPYIDMYVLKAETISCGNIHILFEILYKCFSMHSFIYSNLRKILNCTCFLLKFLFNLCEIV